MTISESVRQRMWYLLQQETPKEACGVLISRMNNDTYDQLIPLHNYSPWPTEEFWMSPNELHHEIALYGSHAATWHSHPTTRWDLSHADKFTMRITNLPMAVVAVMPYPSVSLYEIQNETIVLTQRYRIEEVSHVA